LIIFAFEMLLKKTCTEKNQTGYLLLVALLLSTFSVSGFPNYSQPLKQTTQIELLLSYDLESTQDAKYIYETIEKCNPITASISKVCPINYLLIYERRIETCFKSVLQQAAFNKISDRFYRIKTIPQSSKEDSFISLIG